jgi:hypothetical protein
VIQLFPAAFSRDAYGLPALPCVNVLAEATPLGVILLPRPPIAERYDIGTGPIRGVFRADGVFAGSTFAVSGQELYRLTSSLGAISGLGPVRFAALPGLLVIVGDGKAWVYDGTLAQITDPNLPRVIDVFVLAGRFYFVEEDTGRVVFSAIEDPTTIEGLSFFTAENKPDDIVCGTTLGAEACFLGKESMELWSVTDSTLAPLIFSRKYDRGCAAQATVQLFDARLFFVGDDRIIYQTTGSFPQRVSNHTVEEKLRLCDDIASCTAFTAQIDGHGFYVVNIPGQGSYALGAAGGGWGEWQSYGRDTFRIACGLMSGGEAYWGDAETGQLWKFGTQHLDGTDPITRMVSAVIPLESGTKRLDVLSLQCVRGVGQHTDPEVELSYSDDAGRTWSRWVAASMGQQGEYSVKAIWRQLGLIRPPGRVLRFRTTGNWNFTPEYVSPEPRP